MSDTQTVKWSTNLLAQLSAISEEFELDPIQAERFREFTFGVAKAQYKTGNKSGIAWLHKQLREKSGGAQAATA